MNFKTSIILLGSILLSGCALTETAKQTSETLVEDIIYLHGHSQEIYQAQSNLHEKSKTLLRKVVTDWIVSLREKELEEAKRQIVELELGYTRKLDDVRKSLMVKLETEFDPPVNGQIENLYGRHQAYDELSKDTNRGQLEREQFKQKAASLNAQYLRMAALALDKRQEVLNAYFLKHDNTVNDVSAESKKTISELEEEFSKLDVGAIVDQVFSNSAGPFEKLNVGKSSLDEAKTKLDDDYKELIENAKELNAYLNRPSILSLVASSSLKEANGKISGALKNIPVIGDVLAQQVDKATESVLKKIPELDTKLGDVVSSLEADWTAIISSKVDEINAAVPADNNS